MKKLKILFAWLGLVAYLVFVPGFVSDRFNDRICERISINITDSVNNRFITSDDIMDILLQNEDKILGYPLSTINTLELEMLLGGEPFVKRAEIYKTVDGQLNVRAEQRTPVIRIINRQGGSYYLDREGVILPLSEKYTSRVLVASGNISEPFIEGSTKSIFDVNVPEGERNSVVYRVFEMASYISESDLWSAQVSQIYVDSNYEFEIIPRVGAHLIRFGDAREFETKFRKLEALYLYGFNNEGWNNYEIIDLKYDNQIICTKR